MDWLMDFIREMLQSLDLSQGTINKIAPFIMLLFIVGASWLAGCLVRCFVIKIVLRLVKNTRVVWDDILFNSKLLVRMSYIIMPVMIYILLPEAFAKGSMLIFAHRVCLIWIVVVFLRFLSSVLEGLYAIYSEKEHMRNKPLKGLLQTLQVILFFIGAIVIIAMLINKSPWALLTGLGASAAILMLVFKDSIMGLVSGIQLTANNMLKVGDWISMPKYDADGTVIEVTLNTVKVRNWDNTITTIPPYALVSDSFQNWRGMEESGGRRVKRSISIDMSSVKFCTPEMLEKFRKISLIADYIDHTENVVKHYNEEHQIDNSILVNGRRQTNLGVFRAYLTKYLHSLPVVNHEMFCMVRQLQPDEKGIPLELYFFSREKAWIKYEGIQADVFDHVLAVIPEFDLRVFQSPMGYDLRHIIVHQEAASTK